MEIWKFKFTIFAIVFRMYKNSFLIQYLIKYMFFRFNKTKVFTITNSHEIGGNIESLPLMLQVTEVSHHNVVLFHRRLPRNKLSVSNNKRKLTARSPSRDASNQASLLLSITLVMSVAR